MNEISAMAKDYCLSSQPERSYDSVPAEQGLDLSNPGWFQRLIDQPAFASFCDAVAVGICRQLHRQSAPHDVADRFGNGARRGSSNRLAARRNRRIVLLPLRAIISASVEDRIVFIHTANDRFTSDRTIGELEALLRNSGFFRVSRSNLVNLEHVRELAPWTSGTWKITLVNGVELIVSRDRARSLKEAVGLHSE
jgi:DNA-binding LytR/AlgR family response regulator